MKVVELVDLPQMARSLLPHLVITIILLAACSNGRLLVLRAILLAVLSHELMESICTIKSGEVASS